MSTETKQAPKIEFRGVSSSLLERIGYDAESKTLGVSFKKGGQVYHYANIEPDVWEAFSAAESHGQHFLQNIKPKFLGVKQ